MLNKTRCEFLRTQGRQKFDQVRMSWIDAGLWAFPARVRWLLSQTPGARSNQHIVDPTHVLALRSYVAGFLEGNTSASRPWARQIASNPDVNPVYENKLWLDFYNKRIFNCLSTSNFYHAAGLFYYDFGTFNTGALFIDEIDDQLFFHNLVPGSYSVINNGYGEAVILIREFRMTVQGVVDTYGKKTKNGKWDWSNFSPTVRKLYEDSNYADEIDIVQIVLQNEDFDPTEPIAGLNRQWISYTYETGGGRGQYYQNNLNAGATSFDEAFDNERYLMVSASKRKPFIVGKSYSNGNFEYGETGPTTDALGLIKSLNKKAISKDQALEQMLRPAVQGPASLRKSYVTTASNSYVPLSAQDLAATKGQGLRSIFEINPAIAQLVADVSDMRQQVDRLYYADYLLYLSRNPKTRTATETNAILNEQQLVIGPNLQSLNSSFNQPVIDFVADFVLDKDPYLPEPPQTLEGEFLRTEFISVFAQAQRAADLPQIERFVGMAAEIGQINPSIWDKVNVDRIADLYEDRLYLPAGVNNPQKQVEAKREQAMAMQRRQQALQETLPAVAGAARDVGLKLGNEQG